MELQGLDEIIKRDIGLGPGFHVAQRRRPLGQFIRAQDQHGLRIGLVGPGHAFLQIAGIPHIDHMAGAAQGASMNRRSFASTGASTSPTYVLISGHKSLLVLTLKAFIFFLFRRFRKRFRPFRFPAFFFFFHLYLTLEQHSNIPTIIDSQVLKHTHSHTHTDSERSVRGSGVESFGSSESGRVENQKSGRFVRLQGFQETCRGIDVRFGKSGMQTW